MDLEKLAHIQVRMAKKVILNDGFSKIGRIAGVDVAYQGDQAYAAAVSLSFKNMTLKEMKTVKMKVSFPYIPGYLSFREAGPMKAAVSSLKSEFDILLVNGHGIAHPRGLGIAAHIGVELGISTIGVAKGLLCGEVSEERFGEALPVVFEDRVVGYKLFPGKKGRPIFVSPGNLVSLESSVKIVEECMKGHMLPEPLYAAHQAANDAKKSG